MLEKINAILYDLTGIDGLKVPADTPFLQYGITSSQVIELCATLEQEFGITFEDKEIEYASSLQYVADTVETHVKAAIHEHE